LISETSQLKKLSSTLHVNKLVRPQCFRAPSNNWLLIVDFCILRFRAGYATKSLIKKVQKNDSLSWDSRRLLSFHQTFCWKTFSEKVDEAYVFKCISNFLRFWVNRWVKIIFLFPRMIPLFWQQFLLSPNLADCTFLLNVLKMVGCDTMLFC